MGMDFMERLVRYLSSFFSAFIFFQCSPKEENGVSIFSKNSPEISNEKMLSFSADNPQISFENAGVFYQGKPFSGKLFQVDPQTQDTLKIESYLKGNRHGKWIQYFPGHVLKEFRTFDQGKKTGAFVQYFPTGKKQQEYHFQNDEYQGVASEWNESGVLIREMHYVAGHEEGSQKLFYDNGQIRANYVMKNGRRFGLLGTKNCVNVSAARLLN
jgi:antitoxin component YwqK of YwqJK toxin-antitoxin module